MLLPRSLAALSVLAVFLLPRHLAAAETEPFGPEADTVVSGQAMSEPNILRASGAEFSLGLRQMTGQADDAQVSASIGCLILCVVETVASPVRFRDFKGGGLRADLWAGGRWINAGFGMDMMTARLKADNVSLRYNSTSFFPMLRLPLWRDADMPGGHVNVYGGLMVTRAWGGEMKVSFPALTRPVSGVVTGTGGGAFAGVALKRQHFAVSVEYRDIDLDLEMKEYFDYGYTTVSGSEVQLGLSYLF